MFTFLFISLFWLAVLFFVLLYTPAEKINNFQAKLRSNVHKQTSKWGDQNKP